MFCHRFDDFGLGQVGLERHLGLANLRGHVELHADDVLDGIVRQAQRLHHRILRNLVRAGFHHQDGVLGAGHAQVQGAVFHLAGGGVDDESAIYVADAHRADRLGKGDVRDHQRGGSGNNRQRVQVMIWVCRERRENDLNVVAEAFGEERAQRAIYQAAKKNGRLAGAAFTAEEAARNLTGGIQSFFEINGEWEKVNAWADVLGARGGSQEYGVADVNRHCATGLLGQRAGLDGNLMIAQPGTKTMLLYHIRSFHACLTRHECIPLSRWGNK